MVWRITLSSAAWPRSRATLSSSTYLGRYSLPLAGNDRGPRDSLSMKSRVIPRCREIWTSLEQLERCTLDNLTAIDQPSCSYKSVHSRPVPPRLLFYSSTFVVVVFSLVSSHSSSLFPVPSTFAVVVVVAPPLLFPSLPLISLSFSYSSLSFLPFTRIWSHLFSLVIFAQVHCPRRCFNFVFDVIVSHLSISVLYYTRARVSEHFSPLSTLSNWRFHFCHSSDSHAIEISRNEIVQKSKERRQCLKWHDRLIMGNRESKNRRHWAR